MRQPTWLRRMLLVTADTPGSWRWGSLPAWVWITSSTWLLLVAALPLPYGLYQVTRWLASGLFIYLLFRSIQTRAKTYHALWYGLGVVIFNPLQPIRLEHCGYILADLAAAITYVVQANPLNRLLVRLRQSKSRLASSPTVKHDLQRSSLVKTRLTAEEAYNLALLDEEPMTELRALLRVAASTKRLPPTGRGRA